MLAEAASTFLSDARSQDRKAEALKKGLSEAQAKLGEVEVRAKVAESQLEDARRRILEMESEDALRRSALQASEARAAELTSELNKERHERDVLRLKLQQSEDRERVATARAETAVERFRQSVEYQDELAEEAVDGLTRGFEDFRMQASRFCPQYDFSTLRPRLCAEDWRISSEEEGFGEDFSPEAGLVISAEADLGAPSEIAGNAALDVGSAVLPEVDAEVAAVEAAPVGLASAAISEVVPGAIVVIDPEAPRMLPHVPSPCLLLSMLGNDLYLWPS